MSPIPHANPMQGILLKCDSVAVFTVMAAMIKATSESAAVPAGQQVFFRSLFAIPVILAWLACAGRSAQACARSGPSAMCIAAWWERPRWG